MDQARYGTHVKDTIARMRQQKEKMDEGVFETLSSLMEFAEASGDDALLGFAHYHLADSLYAFEIDYGKFRHHIGRAIIYLQKAGDDAMLTRAYNYASIDASNNAETLCQTILKACNKK